MPWLHRLAACADELLKAEQAPRDYEPASALLDRVRAVRAATPKPGRRRKG